MPRKYSRSYARRRPAQKRSAPRRGKGRRLQSASDIGMAAVGAAESYYKGASYTSATRGNLRGTAYSKRRYSLRGKYGMPAVDADSGAKPGFRVGRRRSMGTVLQRRKKRILSTLADNAFPVIKAHELQATNQIDWTSGTQACVEYAVGYTTTEIENMLTQSNSAQTVSTAAIVAPANVDLVKNQRMDIYDKTTKWNFKNTSSHTVYMEIYPYEVVSYHSYTILQSWSLALADDNMLQNTATFGTEQGQSDIGNRPDFRQPDLNCRYKLRKDGIYKITLEPGQETSYTYVQKGGRFDQQKFNVLAGAQVTPTDVDYIPGFTTRMLVFARSEMVADSIDTDVTYGSGHLAVNCELWKSWSAVPYIKPFQSSFVNNWGTIIEANELDLNIYKTDNDVYQEQV